MTLYPVRLLLLALSIACFGSPALAGSPRPNFVLILADDLGYGDLGSYGQELIQTPRLDRMAQEGLRFTRHYAGSPVCAPSRAVLMTGKHSGRVSIRGNKQHDGPGLGQMPLPAEEATMAELLQAAGYETAFFGKWGLGVAGTSGDPLKRGFDHYFGYLDQVLAHNYFPEFLLRDGERVALRNKVRYLPEDAWHKGLAGYATKREDYSHDLLMDAALSFIDAQGEAPFFLYLPVTLPHLNDEAPVGARFEVPDHGPYADRDWDEESKGYAAMVTRLDRDVGRVLDRLLSRGLAENTLVIFASDNGPLPESFEPTRRFNSSGGLRGGKREVYEGGIRVPMIAWWPGVVRAGETSEHLSAAWDLLPTFAELAGAPLPRGLDGISFVAELRSETQAQHEFLYWEFPLYWSSGPGSQVAVRLGDWKGVRRDVTNQPDAPLEVYNLRLDPTERYDRAAETPEIAAKLLQAMERAHEPSSEFPLYAGEREIAN